MDVFMVGKRRVRGQCLVGRASWEGALQADAGAEELTRESGMWCGAVKGKGIGVCAPVNTRVINETEEVTGPGVNPDYVS